MVIEQTKYCNVIIDQRNEVFPELERPLGERLEFAIHKPRIDRLRETFDAIENYDRVLEGTRESLSRYLGANMFMPVKSLEDIEPGLSPISLSDYVANDLEGPVSSLRLALGITNTSRLLDAVSLWPRLE